MTQPDRLPGSLALVSTELIQPCPIQPRVNVSVGLVEKLAGSMKAGRHEPLLEVEPAPGKRGHYQIVCGEQRWRAAKAAGRAEVLVRIHPRLGYLERLEKQYEENRLRADLDVVEEAHCILLDKTIRDVAVAERLLRDSLVPFQPLDDKRIERREDFAEHLDGLRRLLVKHKTHATQGPDGKLVPGPLSPWRETEQALGISESQRKAKVGVLRLDTALLEDIRELPAEHAIQISRLPDARRQAELAERAHELTHRQVHHAVDRLLANPDLAVDDAVEDRVVDDTEESSHPLAFDAQLELLADLCRQLTRALAHLRLEIDGEQAAQIIDVLNGLRREIDAFGEEAA